MADGHRHAACRQVLAMVAHNERTTHFSVLFRDRRMVAESVRTPVADGQEVILVQQSLCAVICRATSGAQGDYDEHRPPMRSAYTTSSTSVIVALMMP